MSNLELWINRIVTVVTAVATAILYVIQHIPAK